MKKLLLPSVFALLALSLAPHVAAQTGDEVDRTAKNQNPNGMIAESASVASAGPEVAAQKNYDSGVVLYNSGKLPEAIDAFKESNKLKPNDPQTQYMLGMAYWKSKAYIQSVDAFKKAIKLKPEWDEAYFRLGLSYYVLGRTGQSSETYKKLLALNPSLAAKLSRIIGEPKSGNDGAKAKPPAADSQTVAIVPVSAVSATSKSEKPAAPLGDANIREAAKESAAETANIKPAATESTPSVNAPRPASSAQPF